MSIAELKSKITEQQFRLKGAQSRGMMVAQETERMRNLLVNNLDDIVVALSKAVDAEKQIEVLNVEIESADAELQEKDEEIRALKEELEARPAAKVKAAAKRKDEAKDPDVE